jgi:integrase
MALPPLRRGNLMVPEFDLPGAPDPLPRMRETAIPDASAAWAPFTERIGRLTAEANRRADNLAEEAAWEAGLEAGERDPGTQMEGGGAIVRTAFNRAAAGSAVRRLEITSRGELDRIRREHATDPNAFAAAAEAYRNGMEGRLPANVRVPFVQRFDALAMAYTQDARQAAERRVADQAVATMQDVLPQRQADIRREGAASATDPAALARLEAVRSQTVNELVALGPRESFMLGGRQYPADPTRTGALSLPQLQQQVQAVHAAAVGAQVAGAWRAAGGGREWLDATERAMLEGQRPAGAGGNFVDAIVRYESGGRADAANPSSSAVGTAQFLRGTWLAFARANPQLFGGASEAEILARRTDPGLNRIATEWYAQQNGAALQQAGLPATARNLMLAHFLGGAGAAALLRADPNATFRSVAGDDAANANPSYDRDPRTGQPRTVQWTLDVFDRRAAGVRAPGEVGGSAAPAGPVLSEAAIRGIFAELRSERARMDDADRDARVAVRTQVDRELLENGAAIAMGQPPPHALDPERMARAGRDFAEAMAAQRAGQLAYTAQTDLRQAASPDQVQAIADRAAPGTALFHGDPRAALAVIQAARARGVQIGGADLAERIADAQAQADAGGRAVQFTAEEAAAAGLAPERLAEVNRQITLRAEAAQLRRSGATMPPAERAGAAERLRLEGEQAAENAERMRALQQGWQAWDQGTRTDAANYALTHSPSAQALMARVAQGDAAALPQLVAQLRAAQDSMGVPEALRRDLPKPLTEALVGRIADAPDPVQAVAALDALTRAVGADRLPAIMRDLHMSGGAQDSRRQAILVAGAVAATQPALARDIIRGATVLRDNPVPQATGARLEESADRVFGNAFAERPQARSQAIAAALALYAAAGGREGTTSGSFDRGRFEEALERVAPTARWDGQTVLRPPGMDAAATRALLNDLPAEALTGAVAADGRPITLAMWQRGGFSLTAIGPGRYTLRYADRDVPDALGNRFVLDLNGRWPASRGGADRPAMTPDPVQPVIAP